MNQIKAWSYSRWADYAQCPLRFKLKYIDKAPTKETPALKEGNQFHTHMAAYLTGSVVDMPNRVHDKLRPLVNELKVFPDKIIEEQMGFTNDWKPTSWFGKDTWLRVVWDAAVLYEDLTGEVIDHKGLALDTPLRTPSGTVTMGSIRVGDEVWGPDGKPTRVTAKSAVKHLPCFRIEFSGGAQPIVCDHEHLWKVRRNTAEGGPRIEVVQAADLRVNDVIDCPEPVEGLEAELAPRPYTLGCWLGDGHKRDGVVSKSDAEIFEHIEQEGYVVLPVQKSSFTRRTVSGLVKELNAAGLLHNKHLPDAYLCASFEQRKSLLQGFMDTRGYRSQTQNQVVFTSVDETLAHSVHSLVTSLGERPVTFKYPREWCSKESFNWRVSWTPTRFNPFRLPRKAHCVVLSKTARRSFMVIAVNEIESVPTQCIAVDNESHMYLAGNDYVPTHNTGKKYATNIEQLELFALSFFCKFKPATHVTTRLWYHDTGDTVYGEFSVQEVPALKAKWEAATKPMFADTIFAPKPNDKCKWCDFSKSAGGQCRFG